jgi:hypothetical protein
MSHTKKVIRILSNCPNFNSVITNGYFDVAEVTEYSSLLRNMSEENYYSFYDSWIEILAEKGLVFLLDFSVSIEDFTKGVNKILATQKTGKFLNEDDIINAYRSEVVKYTFQGKKITEDFKYDILEANVVASGLRKIGYELICLFNGFDNNIKAVISVKKIEELKNIEEAMHS